jgi:hypothetical protein
MRPSLRPSRDVHGLSRQLRGGACDNKEAQYTGDSLPAPVVFHIVHSPMAVDRPPPEGETSLILNPFF